MARDAAATQQRIIDAAADEFAAHGIAGARVDEIAKRAGVNKRMLYYYFESKEGLFREILLRRLAARMAFAAESADLPRGERVAQRQLDQAGDIDYVRLLMWEALEDGEREAVSGESGRRETYRNWVEATRQAQADGELPADLDARNLVLSEVALTLMPLAFPQLTRLVFGDDADAPDFISDRQDFLRALYRLLDPRET